MDEPFNGLMTIKIIILHVRYIVSKPKTLKLRLNYLLEINIDGQTIFIEAEDRTKAIMSFNQHFWKIKK